MKKVFAVIFAVMLIACMTTMAFAEEAAPVPEAVVDGVIDYWFIIVAAIVVVVVIILAIIKFAKTPHKEQLNKIKQWLLWAVTKAEAEFGSKTGQLKLSYVYDLFVARFPWIAKVIPFALFSEKVDEALDIMKDLLAKDPELLDKVPAGEMVLQEIDIEKVPEEEKQNG